MKKIGNTISYLGLSQQQTRGKNTIYVTWRIMQTRYVPN